VIISFVFALVLVPTCSRFLVRAQSLPMSILLRLRASCAVAEETRRSSAINTMIRGLVSSSSATSDEQGEMSASKQSSRTAPIAALMAPSQQTTVLPLQFQEIVQGRIKRKLGNVFDLTNFGVNLTMLEPGASSALQHYHSKQDEFVYILKGTATLRLGQEEFIMTAGDCVGFKAGDGIGHCITNRHDSVEPAQYLEIGDRTAGDEVEYPEVDLKARDTNGQWVFAHKSGEPYNA
jgi:uncharacterized cupin superfamily protein